MLINPVNKKTDCYCGSQKDYDNCCWPFLTGRARPENPEQLMRSRYSAFCIKDIDYLISTHHPSMQTPDGREVLTRTINETQWLGLKVLRIEKEQSDQGVGYIEFAAFYKTNGTTGQLHEKSKFIHENGQWYYLDGLLMEPLKFGRNDPCWCGSNKKYKKCHGQ